jgi:hypothetical protein
MRTLLLLGIAAAAAVAACGDPFGIPVAQLTNTLDTISLYAVTGTEVQTPSAYCLGSCGPTRAGAAELVRLDESTILDFAFDIDTLGRAVLKPTGAIRLGRNSGLRTSPLVFDSIRLAPTLGYQLDSAVTVVVGTRVIVQSRLVTCPWGGSSFYYAKLEVLAIDTGARRADLQLLLDPNCGYRGLVAGVVPRR